MERSGPRASDARDRPRGGGRTTAADSLVGEVRWQLFRRDDLPARLRRLQRLEDVADAEARLNGAGSGEAAPESLAFVGIAWDVVISGGGFGGFYAARTLERILPPQSARITLVNDVNFLLYTPFLPEAAAGTLEPRHVVTPLRDVLAHTRLRIGAVTGARRRAPDGHDGRPGGRGARVQVRPPGGRARLGVARAADPRARGARDRLQVAVRRDLAAQPRDPVPRDGRRHRRSAARATSC